MNYKDDIRYKIGAIILAISLVDLIISFAFMGFGNNAAIIWFYCGLPIFAIGWFMIVSVKLNYERSDKYGVGPFPPFYRIRQLISAAKKAGVLQSVCTLLVSLISAVLVVLLIICAYYGYNRSAIMHLPQYVKNETGYNEYYELWRRARQNGDEEKAKGYFTVMEQYHNDNAFNRMRIGIYEKKLKTTGVITVVTAGIDLVAITALIFVKTHNRRKLASG